MAMMQTRGNKNPAAAVQDATRLSRPDAFERRQTATAPAMTAVGAA